jgi:glycosyltransferase involved in cell wall biosynthesis
MEDKISVIVATYNQEDTIARTLDSVLMQQCHVPIEIILGEDCSTDGTLAVCQRYADEHPDVIRLIANKQNKGLVDNYFDCILAAQGKYIADCAGDDFWTDPLKLEKEVCVMEQHPNVTMVLTRWNWFNETTRQISPGPTPPFPDGIIKGSEMLEPIVTQTNMNVYHLCTSLYRRDIFLKAYEEYPYLFRNKELATEDTQVAFMMALHGDFAYLPDVTMNYSIGKESASNTTNDERQFHFIRKIMNLCYYLTQQYQIHSSNVDRFFSRRLFALSMHAFRSHRPELYQETLKCEKEWHVRRTMPIRLAYTVMRHEWLWQIMLKVRLLFVAMKRRLS